MTSKEQIMKLLGWDELEYGQHVYEQGMAWIYNYWGKVPEAVHAFETGPKFWAWWKNQWDIRDEAFIRIEAANYCVQTNVHLFYAQHHDIRDINAVPNKLVINEFNRAIRQLQDEIKELK